MIGDAFTWIMSWVSIVGIYRKRRLNTKQISPQLDPNKDLSEFQLTLTPKPNKQGTWCDVSPSSRTPTLELQIKMMKESLEGKLETAMQGQKKSLEEKLEALMQCQQKTEKRVQEEIRREVRRRLEQVEKQPRQGFFN